MGQKNKFLLLMVVMLGLSTVAFSKDNEKKIIVGSKSFNEGYILSEIMAQLLENNGYDVTCTFGLGGTLICTNALKAGEIDIYPEYSGTISEAILNKPAQSDMELHSALADMNLKTLKSFGFNNSYALAMKRRLSEELNIQKISDLVNHGDLNVVLSHEFLNRSDGWGNLQKAYGLAFTPSGIQHGLAYKAIDDGLIDVTDAYSTDGDLERYDLIILEDDINFFPKYIALPLVRDDFPTSAALIINQLENLIDEKEMSAMNAKVIVQNQTFSTVANDFLRDHDFIVENRPVTEKGMFDTLIKNTAVHIKITAIALSVGCVIGLALAFLIYRSSKLSRMIIYISGLLQTIPSIALLALMIPIFGIGQLPAIIALFLYSLLPILRSAITALTTIDPVLKNVAKAIGMTRFQQLKYVLFPIALPNILAGIKTANIICIGTATLAAFIGAGGLGEPIVTGLALNDTNLILQGAIPAACLAILVELIFEVLEKMIIKDHMRRTN
ncbi:MAG: ABC transporter permease subunit [Proteobacteria bacterium]|nr:ABC transporter permease subunit [Pseudomonadota bacterium]